MKSPKIFRPDQLDDRLNEPFPDRTQTLKMIDFSANGGFIARYRKTKFLGLIDDDCLVRRRILHCWMFVGGNQVGAFDVYEYEVDPFIGEDEFLDAMDSDSAQAVELAEIICRNWPNFTESLICHGPIVVLNRLWVAPSFARRSEWAAIALKVIERSFRSRSLLALKAFPLEYEGAGRPNDDTTSIRRHRALIRHYRRLLPVMPFPGNDGEEGWLFAIPDHLKKDMPPPGGRMPADAS